MASDATPAITISVQQVFTAHVKPRHTLAELWVWRLICIPFFYSFFTDTMQVLLFSNDVMNKASDGSDGCCCCRPPRSRGEVIRCRGGH